MKNMNDMLYSSDNKDYSDRSRNIKAISEIILGSEAVHFTKGKSPSKYLLLIWSVGIHMGYW